MDVDSSAQSVDVDIKSNNEQCLVSRRSIVLTEQESLYIIRLVEDLLLDLRASLHAGKERD